MTLILVAGATGGVGQRVVRKLLIQGQPVRILVRNAAKARKLFGAGPEVAVGDVRRPETLAEPMQGIEAVICTIGARVPLGDNSPKQVDYEGVRNLVEAAQAAGVKHFVLVSSLSVTNPEHPLNAVGNVLTWKLKGEETLRKSGLTYTIVRPGGLTDEPSGLTALQFDQGDHIMGRISRADVAEICIQALSQPAAADVTFEVIETEGPPPTDWGKLFGGLKPDADVP
jgi:uncharacterized protein YbjT (DUF2867 family)